MDVSGEKIQKKTVYMIPKDSLGKAETKAVKLIEKYQKHGATAYWSEGTAYITLTFSEEVTV